MGRRGVQIARAERAPPSAGVGARDAAGISSAAMSRLAAQLGVSRVARVTALERGGVEVACAVRPGGHVLQVSNGKGLSFAQARAGAILEAAELWAAEHPSPSQLVFATLDELRSRGLAAWPLEGELLEPALFSPRVRLAWLPAQLLESERFVFVPAAAVHCVPSSGPWLGPALHRWTSNGMGAHPDGERALRHALLEAAERDGLARALPDGWTERELRQRKIEPASLARAAPQTARLVEQLAKSGLVAQLFDLRPRSELRLPRERRPRGDRGPRGRLRSRSERWMGLALAGALLLDEDGPIPLAAGYACAPGADAALSSALLEAAQSRLTEVHGAREDIATPELESLRALAKAATRARPAIDARSLPAEEELPSAALLSRFAVAGIEEVAALDLAPAGCPVRIVKVIAEGLLLSELLQ